MPKVTGNDLVVRTLQNEGVDTVFFLTGGPMSDVAGLCIEMELKSIDARHEQGAAMMAHAFSRLTGKPGVCFGASGPGTTNLLTGIGNSFLDATPVVALGGLQPDQGKQPRRIPRDGSALDLQTGDQMGRTGHRRETYSGAD